MKKLFFLSIIVFFTFSNAFSQKIDSLFAKRIFLATHIYQNREKLSDKKISSIYKDTWQPKIKYKWSKVLKPIGPVVALAGIGVSYIALKGVDASTIVDGITVDYKIRSLPKLFMGLGLFAGGISIIESSNELAQHSVDIYNSMLIPKNNTSYIKSIKFGITESHAIGFSVVLK